jgi:hypothetical protein
MKKTNKTTKKETKETKEIVINKKADGTRETKQVTLTQDENKTLRSSITKIRNAFKSFVIIGQEHGRIQDLVLRKYKTMKSFIESELGMPESAYYKNVRAYDVYKALQSSGINPLPHVESVCRAVTLNVITEKATAMGIDKTPENILCEIWQNAVDTRTKKDGKKPSRLTALDVGRAKEAWIKDHTETLKDAPKGKQGASAQATNNVPTLPSGVSGLVSGEGPGKVTSGTTGRTPKETPRETPDVSEKSFKAKFAEQRTELAKARKEAANLRTLVKATDWQTCDLFKEIFEVGKKAVVAKALETNDTDLINAVAKLEREVFRV